MESWLLASAKWIEWSFSLTMIAYTSILRNKKEDKMHGCFFLVNFKYLWQDHTSHHHACTYRSCDWGEDGIESWKKTSEMLLSQPDEGLPGGTIIIKTEGYFHKQIIEWKPSVAYYKTAFCFCFLTCAWTNLEYKVSSEDFWKEKN